MATTHTLTPILYKLTLFPGDCMWSPQGTHVCDEQGFVKKVQEPTTIEFESCEIYKHVYDYISNERCTSNRCLGQGSPVDLWIAAPLPNPTPNPNPFSVLHRNTLLVPHPSLPSVYIPKPSQCLCSKVYAVTAEDDVRFDAPWVPKPPQPKTIQKQITRSSPVYGTSNIQDIEYDPVLDKHMLKTKTVQYPILETVDIYDEQGQVLFQKEIQKQERITETIDEPVRNPDGTPILESVRNPDGTLVLIPPWEEQTLLDPVTQTPTTCIRVKCVQFSPSP